MSTTSAPKQRLHYFDMLKGVAIFLVVMGHVIAMCVREIDRTPLFKFIEHLHMPLFFFISGWFTYKCTNEGKIVIPNIAQRAIRLLIPMVAVSTLWIYYFPHSGVESPLVSTFEALWSGTWKNGYWFTLVLFEIILIYAVTAPLLQIARNVYASTAVAAGTWAVLLILYLCVLPDDVSGYISLELVASFYPAFIFGSMARRYRDGFMKAVHNSNCQTVAIIVFGFTLYMCSWPWEFNLEPLHQVLLNALLHISLSVIALAVFEKWEHTAYSPEARPSTRTIAQIWVYLGTQSLGIYLLHYFLLFPMGSVFRDTLIGFNLALVPMLAFTAFWAACIIAVVLGLMKIISLSRPLNLLLTGTK